VKKAAVFSEIILLRSGKSYHNLLKNKKKIDNILHYPTPAPGTGSRVPDFPLVV
jgi:hypothetical protein